MTKLLPIAALLLGLFPDLAGAFPPAGRWDTAPMDQPARPSASIGANVAAGLAGARARGQARPAAITRPTVENSCSLDIASVNAPAGGINNSTIILQADIRAPVIQVCR